jgi:hypothetical protein
VGNDEAVDINKWFIAYSRALRMEYGQAMSLAGFDPDVIVDVQQQVANNMIVWLEANS